MFIYIYIVIYLLEFNLKKKAIIMLKLGNFVIIE